MKIEVIEHLPERLKQQAAKIKPIITKKMIIITG